MTHSDDRPKSRTEVVWIDTERLAGLVIDGRLGREFPAPGALMIATWVAA